MGYRKTLVFKRENLLKNKIPNKPGIYRFYNRNGTLLYVGHASRLRHRLQSYNERDCYNTHPTKKQLRNHIHKVVFRVMPRQKAQKIERRVKNGTKFNFL